MPNVFAQIGWSRLLKKRIPTVVGLGLLLVGVGAGIYLVGQGTGGFLPRASTDATPKQVRITNVTDAGFTVSFMTDAPAPGYLRYGTSQSQFNNQIADDRDQLTNAVGTYTTHHISVRGLQPSTQYYFRLGTGSRQLFDNNGQPFSVRTARPLDTQAEAKTAYGTVLSAVGNPAVNSIVYVTAPGAAPLSSLVKENGSWAVPLSSLRTTDLSSGKTLGATDTVRIQVQGPNQRELIETSATVDQLAPLDPLTFGQDNQPASSGSSSSLETPAPTSEPTASADATPSPSTSQGGPSAFGSLFSEQEASQVNQATPVIIKLEDNEVVNTTKPEFVGKAPANQLLQIEVHSETQYNGVVQTDASGNWQWSPPGDLEPGEHTVTLRYTDAQGVQQEMKRTFIVQANTGFPAFVSTPSASLAPSPEPSPTPIVLPSPSPELPSPSPVVTVAPTSAPQPVSGSTSTTVALLIVGTVFFGGGIFGTRFFLGKE